MFNKNYDQDILKLKEDLAKLYEIVNALSKNLSSSLDKIIEIRQDIDEMASTINEVNASHKKAILKLSKR